MLFVDDNADDAYLNRGGPVSVHLPVFVVVTLKLQLQVRPAGGDITQSRGDWVGLSNIPRLFFPSSGVFLVSQEKDGQRCFSVNSDWKYMMMQKEVILSLKGTAALTQKRTLRESERSLLTTEECSQQFRLEVCESTVQNFLAFLDWLRSQKRSISPCVSLRKDARVRTPSIMTKLFCVLNRHFPVISANIEKLYRKRPGTITCFQPKCLVKHYMFS